MNDIVEEMERKYGGEVERWRGGEVERKYGGGNLADEDGND